MSDRVYQHIKTRIIQLKMPPEMEFTEGELAAELNVSKTPVREALGRLRLEGLVTVAARAGYRVTPVTLKDASDLFLLRAVLEGEAAALAAQHQGSAIVPAELNELCHSDYQHEDDTSIVWFIDANRAFHLRIAQMAGNSRLAEMLATVLDQLDRVVYLGLRLSAREEEIVHEHTDLLKAIAAGDALAAREVAVDQVRMARRMVLDALLASESLLSTPLRVRPAAAPGASAVFTRSTLPADISPDMS